MTTDGFAQWQITRQLASLMMELWCWRYGMKIGGLTGKVDKVYWYPALEWEMSLVAGKAVNQINSSYYSVPQKCPCVRLFCQVFNSDNFLMVPSRAHVRRWSFTLIYEKGKTGKSLTDLFPVEDFLNFPPGFHFEYWSRFRLTTRTEMWFGSWNILG